METTTPRKVWTEEEIIALPRDGHRYELIGGELVMSATGVEHEGSPDLAIEILSPSDTVEGIHERIVEYFENGTRLVWVVNLEEETVLVYRSPKPDQLLRAGNILDGDTVVPGFLWPLAEIFEELEF